MAQQQINNGESAALVRQKLNANFDELYNDKASVNHASSSTSYGVGSTSNYGHVKVTNANGLNITNGAISMAKASTSAIGAVQLSSAYNVEDNTKAATAGALYNLSNATIKTFSGKGSPSASLGKVGDIYIEIE